MTHTPSLQDLPKTYEPREVEKTWWAAWEKAHLFSPAAQTAPDAVPFCIVIPPPNVTGSLHIGHALNNTLQDILTRYHRMRGRTALWVFGIDHAGIATQNVVERQLQAEGKNKQDLGRDAFVRRIWDWKETSGGAIREQLKKLGCSLDYAHERFTLDAGFSHAVREVFVRLYEAGLIYRGLRLINWCPRCRTALSDLEVEHAEIRGHLWYLRYPLVGDPQHSLIVATTRPETLLGDTALAVHPEDSRYRAFIGRHVQVPFVNREIPVLADAMVDAGFGSGVVKVTPAHDFNDFELGNRHGLERVNVLREDGRMNEQAGLFAEQDRFECRKNIVQALEEAGLWVRTEEHATSIGHCYRCKTVVEPYLSRQWFVKTAELARPALEAVRSGKTRIIPPTWENTYFHWMENIRDWCISRQLWWGHRIPAWSCGRCADAEAPEAGLFVSREDLERCPRCGHSEIRQEEDVLDTWFSSALWPFATLGWPEHSAAFKTYYPTSALVTGFDILFFWVARMMMMGLYFTGQVPFRDVYIHALVRDAQGQKMSKSKGNVVDPLAVMDRFGTDAFRFTLAALAAQGRDIKLSEERILGYRNFCNKIWNAARFVLSSARPHADLELLQSALTQGSPPAVESPQAMWILAKLSDCVAAVHEHLAAYKFNEAAMSIYHFFWDIYCDWFLEIIKGTLKDSDRNPSFPLQVEFANVALYVLDQSLRLLHPFMPFLTEELWQKILPRRQSLLAGSAFPQAFAYPEAFNRAKEYMEIFTSLGEKIRQMRMELGIALDKPLQVIAYASDPALRAQLQTIRRADIDALIKLQSFDVCASADDERLGKGTAKGVTRYPGVIVFIDLRGVVDLNLERQRQNKELDRLKKGLEATRRLLQGEGFFEKAPPELVAEKRQAEKNYLQKIEEVEEAIARLL